MTKKLIVNADDFGMSRGISDGILEAYKHGIVTSTSLMVMTKWSNYAAKKAKLFPELSVGLHGEFIKLKKESTGLYLLQLEKQLKKFIKLFDPKPTHFDVHGALPISKAMRFASYLFVRKYKLPYRGQQSTVINKYYGMKRNNALPGLVALKHLAKILNGVRPGVSILVCHPGYTSNRLTDPYRLMRIRELEVLTSQEAFAVIRNNNIKLIKFRLGGDK